MILNSAKYHSILADFFLKTSFSRRKVRELPWQLKVSGDYEQLFTLYSELPFFHQAWRTDRYETREFWINIEKNSKHNLAGVYQSLVKCPSDDKISYCEDITELFLETSHIKEAVPLLEFQVQYYRRKDYPFHLLRSISNYATALREAGMFGPAMSWYREQEKIAQNGAHHREYLIALANQASILILQAKYDPAKDLLNRQEKLAISLDDRYILAICLNNQSIVNRYSGETVRAKELLSEALIIARETDREMAAVCEFNQGVLSFDDGDYLEAGIKFTSSLEEFTRIGSTGRIAAALGNLALIDMKKGNIQGATELLDRQEDICTRNNDLTTLQVCLYNKAILWLEQQKTETALDLLLLAEKTARKLEMTEGICKSLIGQALVFANTGKLARAGILLNEAGLLAGEHGLVLLKNEIEALEKNEYEQAVSYGRTNSWIFPIVLVSHLSLKGKPVDALVESQLVMPDWSLMGEQEILSFIRNGGNPLLTDKDGGTALMAAASLRSKYLVEYLINWRLNVNASDNEGTTALMIASNKGATEIMQLLIETGANVNNRKADGFTPLLFAVQSGNPESVRLLLEAGSDTDLAALNGLAPIHFAAYKCDKEIATELLRNGADPMKKMDDGSTAIDIARERCPEILKLFNKLF